VFSDKSIVNNDVCLIQEGYLLYLRRLVIFTQSSDVQAWSLLVLKCLKHRFLCFISIFFKREHTTIALGIDPELRSSIYMRSLHKMQHGRLICSYVSLLEIFNGFPWNLVLSMYLKTTEWNLFYSVLVQYVSCLVWNLDRSSGSLCSIIGTICTM
jgi:hypothetical protein